MELAALRDEFITRKGSSWLWKKIIQVFFKIRRNIFGKDSVVKKYISINARELSKVWLTKLHDQYLLAAGSNAPAPFVRKRLGGAVVIYEAGGDRAGGPAHRRPRAGPAAAARRAAVGAGTARRA